MWRLRVLAFAPILGFGCASDSDKAQWEEVLKDWRAIALIRAQHDPWQAKGTQA
jgi:hypothetical protein